MPTLPDIFNGLREQAADAFDKVSERVRPAAAPAAAEPEAPARSPRGAIPRPAMTAVEGMGIAKTPGDAAAAMQYRDGVRAAGISTGAPAGPASPTSWSATTTGAPGVQSPTVDDLAKKYMNDRLAATRATQATMNAEALAPKEFTGVRSNYVAPQPAPMMDGVGGNQPPRAPQAPAAAAAPAAPMGKAAMVGRGLGIAGGAVQLGAGVQAAREGRYGDAVDNAALGAAGMMGPAGSLVQLGGNVAAGLRDAALKYGVENFIQPTRNPGLFTPELHRLVDGQEGVRDLGGRPTAAAPAQAAAAPAASTSAQAALPQPGQDDGLVKTTRGARVSPDEMIAGTAVPAKGQGAIKVGNRPASKVGGDEAEAEKDTKSSTYGGLRLPQATTLAGHMVNTAALGVQARASAAKEAGMAKEADLGIKTANHKLNVYKTREEIRGKTKADIEKEVEDTITRGLDPKLTKEEREARTTQGKGELMSRMRYTAANRGIDLGDLKPAERRKFLDGEKFRQALVGSRGETLQQIKDYFGQKQFDSDDLASYMPKAVKRDGARGYIIETENGNTMTVRAAAGGRFVLDGPNTPVDMDLLQHVIKAAERQGKGK